MDLVNRYLQAVKAFLPLAQQDDIIDELSENLLSKVEDKEAELGRELTVPEQAALLKGYGHPFLLALQYRPQGYLIGPLVFPAYWFVIKAVLAVMVVFSILLPTVWQVASGKPISVAIPLLQHFPEAVFPAFGWLTAEFAALDYFIRRFRLLEKWNARWDPKALPKVVTTGRPVPQFQSISALVMGIVFIGWWLAVPNFPYLMFGPSLEILTFGPGWHQFHLAVLLLSVVGLVRQMVEVIFPQASRLLLAIRVARDSAAVILLWLAYRADSFAPFADKKGGQLATIINWSLCGSIGFGIVVAAIIELCTWGYDVKRRLRNAPRAAQKKA